MYKIRGPSHTCEGLEACTYDPSGILGLKYGQLDPNGIHGLKHGQLKPHNCGEQTRPNPVPERGESSRITFTLYGHRVQVVWCTTFPLHVVTCMQYVRQGLSRGAVCSTMSVWGNQMPVAVCNLPQQTAAS